MKEEVDVFPIPLFNFLVDLGLQEYHEAFARPLGALFGFIGLIAFLIGAGFEDKEAIIWGVRILVGGVLSVIFGLYFLIPLGMVFLAFILVLLWKGTCQLFT